MRRGRRLCCWEIILPPVSTAGYDALTAKLEKPFIIPVFIPHAGCPHRCVFCNQTDITQTFGGDCSPETIRSRIATFLTYKGPGRGETHISYYGGNFLGVGFTEIRQLLSVAERFVRVGAVDGIRFSTRPDTIVPDRLDLLSGFPVTAVEIGAQSMDDDVLHLARRGHTAEDTRTAVQRLKARGIKVGLQMMVGLPGDTPETSMQTARELSNLSPDFVRIYPTLVLRHSLLATWYRQGRYEALSLAAAVAGVADLYALFARRRIPVVRMGLQATEALGDSHTLVAGPYHPAFGHLVFSKLFLTSAIKLLESTGLSSAPSVVFQVHPGNISKMRGIRNRNVEILKEMFHINHLRVVPDPAVSLAGLGLMSPGGGTLQRSGGYAQIY